MRVDRVKTLSKDSCSNEVLDNLLFVHGCHFDVSKQVKSQVILAQEVDFTVSGQQTPLDQPAPPTTPLSQSPRRPQIPLQDVADKADVLLPHSMSLLRATLKTSVPTVLRRRTFATTPIIMSDKQQWLCILPDGAGMLEKRMEVRPYVETEMMVGHGQC